MLNACHLVLEDSVTDRAVGEAGKRASERAGKPADFSFTISKSTHCNVSPQTGSLRQTAALQAHI